MGVFFYPPTQEHSLRFASKHACKTHLYLIPRTEVPVTIGCVVCCLVPSMAAAACPAPRAGPAAEWQSILDDETRGASTRKAAEHSKCASMQRFLTARNDGRYTRGRERAGVKYTVVDWLLTRDERASRCSVVCRSRTGGVGDETRAMQEKSTS